MVTEHRMRRSLARKLTVTSVLLALGPLTLVTGIAALGGVRTLRANARATLSSDVQAAAQRAERSIEQSSQHLNFLTEAFVRDRLSGGEVRADDARLASLFLQSDSSAILRVKAIGADGELVFHAGLPEGEADLDDLGGSGEFFYLVMAEGLPAGRRTLLPVELRDPDQPDDSLAVIPAIAIVQPLSTEEGEFLGVVIAEASLPQLFSGLDLASPGLDGVTGLVSPEGLFVYHSVRQNDWARLLASQGSVTVHTDFSTEVADAVLSGTTGIVSTSSGEIVSYRPLAEGSVDGPPLVLYRSVPLGAVEASVRRFLALTLLLGTAILGGVLWTATRASRAITRPVRQLQAASHRLAAGGRPETLEIHTGDELEELARDFAEMAERLAEHREDLEARVAERTRDLELTRAELDQVVQHSADAIIGLDTGGGVRLWNRGAEQLFGYASDDALGGEINELIGRPDGRHEAESIRATLAGGGSVINLRTERTPRGGAPFPVTLTQTVIRDEEGGIQGSSLVIRDHRIQSRLEERMRQSERLAAVSVMAAGLAHEINNPLAVLGTRIELMKREAPETNEASGLKRDLDVLGQHVDRLRGLTSDLLAFARDSSHGNEVIDLFDLSTRVAVLLEGTFVSKGVRLRVEGDPGPVAIRGNAKAVETVLINLLVNASHAADPGGEVVAAVRPSPGGGSVDMIVEDSGPGVPAEIRERIFEPFFTTRKGSGLGLTVCRTIMERHGGSIQVDPEYSGGTRFIATFPVADPT